MTTTIIFNSECEAQAVSQHLRDTFVEETNLVCNYFDRRAFDLALSLENISYHLIPYSICHLPIPEAEWNSFECHDLDTPRIYVACLSSYRNNKIHGIWLDAAQEPEDLRKAIDFMLSWSPIRHLQGEACEDYAIHYYENFEGICLSEYESLKVISSLAKGIKEYGQPYAIYADGFGLEYASLNDFDDRYLGCWNSVQDYVEDYYDSSGLTEAIGKAGLEAYYIDFAGIARDWEINGNISVYQVSSEEVYIFSNS